MSNANETQYFLQQEVRKFEQHCQSALGHVGRARDMWEVVRATSVPTPSVLRGVRMPGMATAKQSLTRAAEKRLSDMLDAQLKNATELADLEERKKYLGRLRLRDWDALRGPYAVLYRKADMEGRRLLASP